MALNHSSGLKTSNKPTNNSIESKLNNSSSLASNKSSTLKQISDRPQRNPTSTKNAQPPPAPPQSSEFDFAALAAMQQHFDPNTRAALAASSLMDQDKFIQEILQMTLAANNSGAAANPFSYLNQQPIPPPMPPPAASSRPRSSSPHTDRSQSPGQQPTLDFGLFMNNLMQYQMLNTGTSGAPAIPGKRVFKSY